MPAALRLPLQMISLMDNLLKRENLDLRLTPYTVLPTGAAAAHTVMLQAWLNICAVSSDWQCAMSGDWPCAVYGSWRCLRHTQCCPLTRGSVCVLCIWCCRKCMLRVISTCCLAIHLSYCLSLLSTVYCASLAVLLGLSIHDDYLDIK
jgi:hypothetical protein